MKRGFWRFGRAKSDEDVVAESDVTAWDAAEEFEVAAEADEPVLDEPEVVESEVEVVAEADEFAVDAEESAAVKRGFWRFGRAKSDEDVVAESDVTAWDAPEEFEVAAEADEPVLDEPEVVESEVEVVAEADEFAVDAEESAAVKRGFWRFGRAKSDEDVVAESDVAAWDAAEEFEVAAEADEWGVSDEPGSWPRRRRQRPRSSRLPSGRSRSSRLRTSLRTRPRSSRTNSGRSTSSPPRSTSLPRRQANDAYAAESAAEKAPFFEREISFKRETSDKHEDLEVVDEESLAWSATESVTDVELDWQLEPVYGTDVGHETAATSADEILPVAAARDTVDVDHESDADHHETGDESAELAEPIGLFSSRKRKGQDTKSSKRRQDRSGKGRKVVGLKIGASQIAAAVVVESDEGSKLLQLARRPLAAGIVVDGEVRDEVALAAAIKLLFDEEKLPKSEVRIGLSSNRIGVRTLDVPAPEDDERFENAVRFKAHEVLPVALDESLLDYRVLDRRIGEDGVEIRRVLLVVAPRDQVTPYQRVAAQAGLKIAGVDLEALGLLRAFVAPQPAGTISADATATVVVSIGHESSTLLVAGGGTCEFTRIFRWGGAVLEEAIASSLDVPHAEAATILRHLSLSGPGRQYAALDELARAQATDVVRQGLTPFARELVNSLQFYQTQPDSLGIGGIVITGGTSQLEGLGAALHQMIGVDVSVGDPLARVSTVGDFDPAIETSLGSMAVSIGLGIDDDPTRTVNLLPKDATQKQGRRASAIKVGVPIAAALPLVAFGFLFIGAHSKASSERNRFEAIQAEMAALPEPSIPVIDDGVVADDATRATALASVLGGRVPWDGVFRDLTRVLPADVWLTSLSLQQSATPTLADGTAPVEALPGQGAPIPTAVSIEGYTYSQPSVALLLSRLSTLPSLRQVTLTSSESADVGAKGVVHFVIVADLNSNGGAS